MARCHLLNSDMMARFDDPLEAPMSDQNVLGQPAGLTLAPERRGRRSRILSRRDRYARGEVDESDERAPGRGIMLAIVLGVLSWIGIVLLAVFS